MNKIAKILEFEDLIKNRFPEIEEIVNRNINLFPYVYEIILLNNINTIDLSNIANNNITINCNSEHVAYITFLGKTYYHGTKYPLLLIDEDRDDLSEGSYQFAGFIDYQELDFLLDKKAIYHYKMVDSKVNIYNTNLLNDKLFNELKDKNNDINGVYRTDWFNEK